MTHDQWHMVSEIGPCNGLAMKRKLFVIGTLISLAVWSVSAAAQEQPLEGARRVETPARPQAPADVEAFVNLGFSHWFGETFGAPPGMTTPALVVGVRPGTSLLELRAHYTLSLTKHELPANGERSVVGFGNLDVMFNRELRVYGERMILQFGPAAGFVHTSQGLGFAYGAVFAGRYMIDVGKGFALGPFFDVRWQVYELAHSGDAARRGDDEKLDAGHSDAQSHLGVALSFW